jgi:hypothetical protein
MTTGSEKLATDLDNLEAMADKRGEYLPAKEIFWSKIDTDYAHQNHIY